MTDTAQASWVTGTGEAEIRREPLPIPGKNEVRVRSLYSGISRGTETLVYRGEVPPSEFQRMRAPFQQGDFPAPVKYGYITVGEVEHGPAQLMGRPVFSLHPHQDRFVVPASAVVPIPASVPPARAVLTANMETAINGLWDAAPRVGDSISVIGAGAVGCLMAHLAGRIAGCTVELIDIDPDRSDTARQLGVSFALPDQARADADLVIHCSGSSAGLDTALSIAGMEATVLEMSWYGSRTVATALGAAFHSRRLTLKASQVGQVATAQRARWDYQRRLMLALRLLQEPVLDCLITSESGFQELPAVMASLASGESRDICHRIVYPPQQSA